MKPTSPEVLSDLLDRMTPEQLDALKAQIRKKESEGQESAEEKEDSRENTDTNE